MNILRIVTWSPFSGIGPDPVRRSNALTPPEFGSSDSSAASAAFEEIGEENGKVNVLKVVVIIERDRAALLDVVVDKNGDEEEDGKVAVILDGRK